MNTQDLVIPTTCVKNAGYEFEVIDTSKLDHYHVRCITHTLYDNRKRGSKLDGFRVEISLMDAEAMIFLDSMNLYANFTESNRASNGIRRIKSARYHYNHYYETQEAWFKQLLKENKIPSKHDGTVRLKTPKFYTCGLRLSNVRRSADKGCALLILDEKENPKLYAFSIGKLRYVFNVVNKTSNKNCPAQYGKKTIDVIECIDYNDESWEEELELETLLSNLDEQ